eukprot:gene951-1033_t
MGCTLSHRSDNKILHLLNNIIFSTACGCEKSEEQLEFEIAGHLKKIRSLLAKEKSCQPLVLHEFHYAMVMLRQRRARVLLHIRQDVVETLLLISSKSPYLGCDLSIDQRVYLDQPIPSEPSPSFRSESTATCSLRAGESVRFKASGISSKTATLPVTVKRGCKLNEADISQSIYERPESLSCTSADTDVMRDFKLKSFYRSRDNHSQDTLGDFGFYDEERGLTPSLDSFCHGYDDELVICPV